MLKFPIGWAKAVPALDSKTNSHTTNLAPLRTEASLLLLLRIARLLPRIAGPQILALRSGDICQRAGRRFGVEYMEIRVRFQGAPQTGFCLGIPGQAVVNHAGMKQEESNTDVRGQMLLGGFA